jgi:hypothetical protein
MTDKPQLDAQGKGVLRELVGRDNVDEYNALTEEERVEIVQEFEEYKAKEAKTLRQSDKARVSDVANTVKAVESEVSHRSKHCEIIVKIVMYTALKSENTYGGGGTTFCHAWHYRQ